MLRTAFRANIVPAVALWGFAFSLLLLYYIHPATHSALDSLAALKISLGLGFVMPAQALAGGLLPFLFQKLQSGDHRKTALVHLPYFMAFWALQGGLVDGFYTLQAAIFGDHVGLSTILCKVAIDVLVFTPFLSTPLSVMAFEWKDAGFSLQRFQALRGEQWYRRRLLPIYFAGCLVWVPTVAVLYALPLALQFPIQAIVQCFWGLVLVIMTAKKPEPACAPAI